VAAELDRWYGDGDWTHDPWFLDAEDDVFVSMGFALDARRESAANLAKLYTPEVCRAIREDPEGGYGIAVLMFHRYWPGMLIPLLEVGRDLGVVQPWDDARLLTRLTKRDQFHEAALELRVLANLQRQHYSCERVPEDSSKKTPDLRTKIGLEWHDVEIKAVHPSPVDDAAESLHQRLSRAEMHVPGFELQLLGGEAFATRATSDATGVMKEAEAIVDAFVSAASAVRDARKPGDYPAPPYGFIRAIAGPTFGSVTPVVMPELSQHRRVVKAIRLVRRAAEQLRTRRGIALIGVWRSAHLIQLADAIQAAAREEAETFRTCHMVVLVDSVPDHGAGYGSIPLALPVQVHERRPLTKAQLKFASIAAGNGRRQASFVRQAEPDEPAVELTTTRRKFTAVSLGAASLPVGGGTMKFYLDGRSPEVLATNQDCAPESAEDTGAGHAAAPSSVPSSTRRG
jgi:hypothetical protein